MHIAFEYVFSAYLSFITNVFSINEFRGVTGRVDVVHSIYLDFRNCPWGEHVSVQYVVRL